MVGVHGSQTGKEPVDFQELKFFGFVYQLVLEGGWRRKIREKKGSF